MKTTQLLLNQLRANLQQQYAAALAPMPIKKAIKEALIDGYNAGINVGVHHTVGMLGVEVEPLDDTCIHCQTKLPKRARA